MTQAYFKVRDAAKYAGVSERTFRSWLRYGLKHTRPIGRKSVLVKYEWIDEFLDSYAEEKNRIDTCMDLALEGLE